MTIHTTPSRRRRRLTVAGITLGAAFVVAAPLAASAHIHVSPEDAAAAATSRLAFSFSHGCDGAATTALVVTVPDGVDGVTPVFDAGWTVARELGADGIPTQVTYTAASPVDDGLSASVAMDVIFSSSVADTDVAFPILQQCVTGETDWSQVAEAGEDAHDLESPAPVVAVGAAVEEGDGHGSAGEEGHEPGDTAAPASNEADPVARWLSGGALAAAVAALVVALVRRRRA
jgi:uncharacterized protein YcnI